MNTLNYLFWGYTVVWVGLALFLWRSWSHVRAAEKRLDQLEKGR